MGTRYKQLTPDERVTIYHWHANGKSARWIGEAIGRATSTVTRELARNGRAAKQWPGGYDPVRAQGLAERRRRWDGRFKLMRQPRLREMVRNGLAMGWSPEQVAGRLAREHGSTVISHEAIYRFVYHRSAQKDYWHKLLPRRKYRRGRRSRAALSPVHFITRRMNVALRPAAAADRQKPGHWEADLLLFRRYGQAVLVLHERQSRLTLLAHKPSKAAGPVARQLYHWLEPLPEALRQTITFDNGTEFARHYTLQDDLRVQTYFCDPRRPWQKGGVENANGRLRRFLPRQTNLADLAHDDIENIACRYNNTPRKCLGFLTPAEVFSTHLLHFNRESTCPLARA